jgi:competence protein ComEA
MTSFRHLTQRALMLGLCALAMPAFTHSAHAEAAAAHAENEQAAGVVNINTATAEELDRLPGVGPSRAQAILELRGKVKRFSTIDDLMRVKGIGRTSLRKLRPMLALDGATAPAARATPPLPPRPDVATGPRTGRGAWCWNTAAWSAAVRFRRGNARPAPSLAARGAIRPPGENLRLVVRRAAVRCGCA